MTREEAYNYAMRACEKTWNEKTCKQIKEALEQTRWIPVSERLPEEGGEYLITWTGVWGFEKRSKPFISITEYEIFEPDNYADWITNISSDFEHFHDIKVIAWMPLPKPYEPQESEE